MKMQNTPPANTDNFSLIILKFERKISFLFLTNGKKQKPSRQQSERFLKKLLKTVPARTRTTFDSCKARKYMI